MLVDTGSQIPVVALWLAREAHLLATGETETGRDTTGHDVPMQLCAHPQIAIEGWGALPDHTVGVVRFPDGFEQRGVGAILSPQALAAAGSTTEVPIRTLGLTVESLRDVASEARLLVARID